MYNTLLAIMAAQFINTPYKWGGNNYDGLDCSGLVLKSLHEIGITLPDMTAQSLYHWAIDQKELESCEPEEDCLLFFGHSTSYIKHVSIALNKKYMIEAGGAGRESLQLTREELAKKDARVRIKPITNRGDLVASVKLKY